MYNISELKSNWCSTCVKAALGQRISYLMCYKVLKNLNMNLRSVGIPCVLHIPCLPLRGAVLLVRVQTAAFTWGVCNHERGHTIGALHPVHRPPVWPDPGGDVCRSLWNGLWVLLLLCRVCGIKSHITPSTPSHLIPARHSVGSPFTSVGPRLTSRDWRGIRPPIDAAIVGRVHLTPKPTPRPARRRSSQRRRTSRRRSQRRRQSRQVLFDDLFGFNDYLLYDSGDISDYIPLQAEDVKMTPMQNVYFFKKGL